MAEHRIIFQALSELATPVLVGAVVWFIQDQFRRMTEDLKSLKLEVHEVADRVHEHEVGTARRLGQIEATLKERRK